MTAGFQLQTTGAHKATNFVSFVDVQKTYDGKSLVIKDLNLAIRRNEFLTLLGPSGSGKTTTLMMLAGFEKPTSGQIVMDGRDLSGEPPYRRNLGLVFQDYALFPHMTVAENVAYSLKVRRVSSADQRARVSTILELVKLSGFSDRHPAQLSGGQQQRVALARALVFEPQMVLMDEPLGALDKQLREHMQLEIKHLQQQLGVTVVYVTHDQAEALTMSDRIAVFDDGNISQLDTPSELYERPKTAFVAQFIGENNRLRGQLLDCDRGSCVVEVPELGRIVGVLANGSVAIGSAVVISVRPERIVIDPADNDSHNVFDARLDELIYLGNHVRARLSLGPTVRDFYMMVPAAEAEKIQRDPGPFRIGWPIGHGRVFRAS